MRAPAAASQFENDHALRSRDTRQLRLARCVLARSAMRLSSALALLLAGCEENLLAEVPDGGLEACPVGEVRWPMTIHKQTEIGAPLPGVRGCLLDQPGSCVTTDTSGVWAPCVPKNADVAFTFEKDGYAATIYAIHTIAAPPDRGRWTELVMFGDAGVFENWTKYGIEYPPTTRGLVWIQTLANQPDASYLPPGIGGVSATFTPSDGAQGPYYSDAAGNYDPAATATIAARPHIFAALMPAGDQAVTLSDAALPTCAHLDGGWTVAPNTLRLPVRAGFRTYMATTCY